MRFRGLLRIVAAALFVLVAAVPASAHEVRPAYLELRETKDGEFDVLFKTPTTDAGRLSLTPEFSGRTASTPVLTRATPRAALQTWTLHAASLRGSTVRIRGLEATMTDALVRVEFADGSTWTQRLTPGEPSAVVPERPTSAALARSYFSLGVEHILTGVDHLLFVLALLVVTGGGRRILMTVTAFTLSHSATLTLAALGFVHVPPPPVEATIALSIVFVAAEIARGGGGVTSRAPWVVAFAFGLLHGLGFAGGLTEAGLPEGHVPLALVFFSAGVETGHFLFVGAVLALAAAARRLVPAALPRARPAVAYAVGVVATFWVFQRLAAF